MGDPTHLERMGRELKCPICWSLLGSAVSLTCNHVFCNPCIEKLMKSGSNCPVCKVPFRRREVRPAPHMDNLVTIYKSMEVASGINMFVTQNVPIANLSSNWTSIDSIDEKRQCEVDANTGKKDPIGTHQNLTRTKKTLKEKASRKKTETSAKSSGADPVKRCFPRKKRVQVPQSPFSETPLRLAKSGSSPSDVNKEGISNKKLLSSQNEAVLSPFFWLREEEGDEKSSQRTNEDQLNDTPTPTPNVPSFSDLKDSDDENHSKGAPSDDVQDKARVDLFDSEMFEWTQRPCSPELCSSPFEVQVADSQEYNINQRNNLVAASNNMETNHLSSENAKFETSKQDNGLADIRTTIHDSPQIRSAGEKNGLKISKKRGRKAWASSEKDKSQEHTDPVTITNDDSNRLSKFEITKQDIGLADVCTTIDDSSQIKSADEKNGLNISKKRGRKAWAGSEKEKSQKHTDPVTETNVDSNRLFKFEIIKQDNGLGDVSTTIDDSPQIKSADEKNGLKVSKKKGRKAWAASEKEKSWKHRDPVTETNVDSNILSKANEKQIMNGIEKSNLEKTTERGKRKTNTKPVLKTSWVHPSISGVFGDAEAMVVNDSPATQCKQKHERDFTGKNSARNSQRKRQKLGCMQNMLDESSKLKILTDNNDSLPSSILSLQDDENKKASGSRLIKSNAKNSKSSNRELGSDKKSKFSSISISQHKKVKAVQPNERGLCNTDLRDLDDSSKAEHCSLMNEVVLRKCENHIQKHQCAFCLSSEESEASGGLLHYCNGKPVAVDYEGGSRVIHAHKNCTEWAPNVYFEDDVAVNLEAEITRSRKIKCGFCGLKGAALGCYEKSCRRSFHVPCAKWTSHCRWDMDNFVMLCPVHASLKLPCESSGSQKRSRRDREQSNCGLNDNAGKQETARCHNRKAHGPHKKIVLCCSALSLQERDVVSEFERVSRVSVLKSWDSSVTHVVASTDESGACKRTLKVLLGILEGKWVLNMEWIKASVKAMEPVNEEPYEITVDVHGNKDGPRLGRLRVLNKQPKLFEGYQFYFMGDFLSSYKGYLHNLVTAAGGIVLHRKPVSGDQKAVSSDSHQSQTLIIYSLEHPDKCDPSKKDTIFSCRRCEAEALANSTGSEIASNLWILNSIAGCKLHNLAE